MNLVFHLYNTSLKYQTSKPKYHFLQSATILLYNPCPFKIFFYSIHSVLRAMHEAGHRKRDNERKNVTRAEMTSQCVITDKHLKCFKEKCQIFPGHLSVHFTFLC